MALKNEKHHSRVRESNKMCCCVPQMASSAPLLSAFSWPVSSMNGAEKKQGWKHLWGALCSSLISIFFLPSGFKLSLETLGCVLLSWPPPFFPPPPCFAHSLSVKWDENLIWKLKLIDLNKLRAFCWLYGWRNLHDPNSPQPEWFS